MPALESARLVRLLTCCLALVLATASLTGCRTSPEEHLRKGQALFEKKSYREAVLEYRNAVRANPNYGDARYALALALLEMGDPASALKEMVRAADLLPDRADVQLQAGRLLLLAGQFEDAKARAEKVLEKDLRNVDALILQGNASAGLRDFDAAITQLQKAVQEAPNEGKSYAALGAVQQLQGNVQEAERSLKNALSVAPRSVGAHLALANYYWSTGNRGQAEQVLASAKAIAPRDRNVLQGLLYVYLATGRANEAKGHLQEMIAVSPEDQTPRFVLADLLAEEKRTDDALKALEPLAGNEALSGLVVARLSMYEHQGGRVDAAYKRLADRLAQQPKDIESQTMLARLALADRRSAEALKASQLALSIDPNRFEALYVLGSVSLDLGRPDDALAALRKALSIAPRAMGPKLQLARAYMTQGQVDSGLQFAQEALNQEPGSAMARYLVVRGLLMKRDATRAEEALRPLARAIADSPEVQVQMGEVARLKGDLRAAERAFSGALQAAPDSIEALSGLVAVEISSGRKAEAIARVENRVKASPKEAGVLAMAAAAYSAVGDDARAEQALKELVSAAPDSLLAYENLARLYWRQKRLDDARAQFEHLANEQPKAIGPQTMVGIILQLQGKQREAQAAYEKLLQANPEAAVAANNLAMLYVEDGGNLDLALNYAQTALKGQPGDPDVNDTLGLVYLKKGLGSLAVRAFEDSTKAAPGNPVFWFHLGQANQLAGDKAKARAAFERALAINPEFDGAVDARRLLAELMSSGGGAQR